MASFENMVAFEVEKYTQVLRETIRTFLGVSVEFNAGAFGPFYRWKVFGNENQTYLGLVTLSGKEVALNEGDKTALLRKKVLDVCAAAFCSMA